MHPGAILLLATMYDGNDEGLMMALLLPERMLGGYDGDPDGINGA